MAIDKPNPVDKHFTGDENKKIFDGEGPELPSVEEEVKSQKSKVKNKYDIIKRLIIGFKKIKLKEYEMNILKLVGALIALIAAFVFVFLLPGAGFEGMVIAAIAAILNALGITDWRVKYGLVKEWYASKTIWGSLVVVLPLIALVVINFLTLGVPAWVTTVLYALIVAGGGTQIYGIFMAVKGNGK